MKNLNEGLDYKDLKGQLDPNISIDEYSAKIGKDSDIVTVAFVVKSKLAGEDLVGWLEKGYDYILDSQVSDGEITSGKYLVFAELKRRSTVPEKIVEILGDLSTLTDYNLDDWKIKIEDSEYSADKEIIKNYITLSPHEYRVKKENIEELNEYREIAGLANKNIYENIDDEIKKFIRLANI